MTPSSYNQRKGQGITAAARLLVGTNNPGKVREYRELLKGVPFTITTPTSENLEGEVDETGSTFEENALLKARHFAQASGLLTLADDSGLEVDALNGGPGIRSARYGGPGLTDEERVTLLLSETSEVPWERRTARFRCVIALVWPSGDEATVEGSCEGYIAYEPKGTNGFGYDPVFFYPDLDKTFAELDSATKHRLSHRGQAARKAVERLRSPSAARLEPKRKAIGT
ncbi:MAG: XTP/dITP diphosphatase [Chloroflexi bacterium]|nr:XTP/dITP diphosphatase [Chloroflexota bacterium]